MRLSEDAFAAVQDALSDAFTTLGAFESLTRRCLGVSLDEITEGAPLPVVVKRVIEYAESTDKVDRLIRGAKKLNKDNQLLAALDESKLQQAPSTAEVIDAGSGAASFKERLKEALAALDSPGMQLVATNDLSTLLDEASEQEADTLYLAVLGNVKMNRPDEVVSALAPVVARCLRRRLGDEKRPDGITLDLARTRLPRIDLSGLDLHEADLAFGDLRHAKLESTNLWRSRAYAVDVTSAGLSRSNLEEARWHSAVARKTRFHDCRMTSIVLKKADLTAAEFQRSRLQGAHFELADVTGALFEQANLADADFRGVTIDAVAVESIARAVNWDNARFDPATRALIAASAKR